MKNKFVKAVMHKWKKDEDKEYIKKPIHSVHHDEVIKSAMHHADELGEGAKKRKKLSPKNKIETVMKEFKHGTLHSGGGAKVKNRRQAIAIALHESGLSEARKHGEKVSPKPSKMKKKK